MGTRWLLQLLLRALLLAIGGHSGDCQQGPRDYALWVGSLSCSAIRTKSAIDLASIFRMTLPRWTFTVTGLSPSSVAICLLERPAATRSMVSRSRAVNESKRLLSGAMVAA